MQAGRVVDPEGPAKPGSSRPGRDLLGWGILATSAAYLAGHSAIGLNIWDAGPIPSGALRLMRGELPYRDFYGYQLGPYLLAVLVFRFWETSLRAYHLAFALVSAAAPWAAYRAARHLVPRAWALIAALIVLLAPGAAHARWLTIALLLGLVLTLALERRPGMPAWRAGLAAGGIVMLNLEMGGLLGMMLLVQALRRPDRLRRLAGLALGAAPAIAVTAALAAAGPGGPGELTSFTWHQIFRLREAWGTPWPSPAAALARGDRGLFFEALVCWWAPLTYAAVAVVALARRRLPAAAGWVLAWGLVSQGLVVWRAGFGNSIRVLGPAVILQIYLAHLAFRQAGRALWRARLAGLAGLAAYLPLGLFTLGISLLGDEAAGALAEVRHPHIYLDHPRLQIWAPMPEGGWLEGIAAAVESLSEPGQPILSVPYCAIVYYVADRPNPTHFEWLAPGMLASPAAEETFLASLRARPPAVVVYRDYAFDGREERRLRRYAPGVEAFIRSRYTLNGQVGPYGIWSPRGPVFWDLASDLAGRTLVEHHGTARLGASGEHPAVALADDARLVYELKVPAAGAVLAGRLAPVPGADTVRASLHWRGSRTEWSAELRPGAGMNERLEPGAGVLEVGGEGVAWVGLRAIALGWLAEPAGPLE